MARANWASRDGSTASLRCVRPIRKFTPNRVTGSGRGATSTARMALSRMLMRQSPVVWLGEAMGELARMPRLGPDSDEIQHRAISAYALPAAGRRRRALAIYT